MINRFALSFLCIELDRNEMCGVMLLYILLTRSDKRFAHINSETRQTERPTNDCATYSFTNDGAPRIRVRAGIIHNTMPMQRIIRKHGVVYHTYADDTQLYVTYKPNVLGDMQRAVKQLEDCISEIRVWMINRMLKLNDNNTDMVIYMSQYHLNKYGRCDISIGDSTISPVECVRNLGVQIDQHLTMDKQVTAVCKACNFHLYRLSSIRRYITTDAARSVVQALITSRLDYCNSLLANLTNTQMKRLKSIQHKAARLVARTPLREHITPVLKQLHWLPVECRITYTLMVLVYKCVNDTAPAYLCRLIQPKCRDSRLRQPSDLELHRPVAKKAIGTAAFGFVGPDRWNKLPERLRESASLNIFKRDLKCYYRPQQVCNLIIKVIRNIISLLHNIKLIF